MHNNVENFERAALQQKIRKALASGADDAAFAEIIARALDLGIAGAAFRDAFGLTAGTAERWAQAKNLPLRDVRAQILEWILSQDLT